MVCFEMESAKNKQKINKKTKKKIWKPSEFQFIHSPNKVNGMNYSGSVSRIEIKEGK